MARRTQPIYSLGYQLRRLPEFIAELLGARVQIVIDVRETAWSRKPGFSKRQLEEALAEAGIEYIHAPFAGNPKELRKSAERHEDCLRKYQSHLDGHPEVLSMLSELLEKVNGSVVCFICYERHPDDCHRRILLEHWAARSQASVDIHHLAVDGAPRFV